MIEQLKIILGHGLVNKMVDCKLKVLRDELEGSFDIETEGTLGPNK